MTRNSRILAGSLAAVALFATILVALGPPASDPELATAAPPAPTPSASVPVTPPVPQASAAAVDYFELGPDGTATIAGRTSPGARVRMLLDGEELASLTADPSGAFAGFPEITAADRTRALTFEVDGKTGDSDTILVQPGRGGSAGEQVASLDPDVPSDVPANTPSDAPSGTTAVQATDRSLNDEPGQGASVPIEAQPGDPDVAVEAQPTDPDTTVEAQPDDPDVTVDAKPGDPGATADDPPAPLSTASEGTGEDVTALVDTPATGSPVETAFADTSALATPSDTQDLAEDTVPALGRTADSKPSATPTVDPPRPTDTLFQDAPAALASPDLIISAEGVRSAGTSQPTAAVALDAISYDASGEVRLTGRAPGVGELRIYIDNRPVGQSPLPPSGGWQTSLPQVDPGTYTLRIDQIGADGTVQSRIETPFLKEDPAEVRALREAGGGVQQIDTQTVQAGHTLWAFASDRFDDGMMYVAIYEANADQIRDPDLIYPGQVFVMPQVDDAGNPETSP